MNNGGFRHVIAQRRNLSAERVGKQAAQIKYYISRRGKGGREAKWNHSRAPYLYLDLKKCSPPLSDLQPVLLWTCCPWKRDVVHLRLHRFWLLLLFRGCFFSAFSPRKTLPKRYYYSLSGSNRLLCAAALKSRLIRSAQSHFPGAHKRARGGEISAAETQHPRR